MNISQCYSSGAGVMLCHGGLFGLFLSCIGADVKMYAYCSYIKSHNTRNIIPDIHPTIQCWA